jgi:MFS family permease
MNRLMRAKNPSYTTPHAGNTRIATLVSREVKSTVPRAAWVSAWVLWAALGAIAAWGYVYNGLPSRMGYVMAMFFLAPAVFLAFGPTLAKTPLYEPEPMDPNNSTELSAAYAKHRKARSWLFFLLPVCMMIMFGVCSVVIAWLATSPEAEGQIGLYGGIAGTIVGIAGAVAGTYFGAWRAKLNQKVRDLTAEQQKSVG